MLINSSALFCLRLGVVVISKVDTSFVPLGARQALRTMRTAQHMLALFLYEHGKLSLGKACEWGRCRCAIAIIAKLGAVKIN